MKKLVPYIVVFLLVAPNIASAAPVSWDFSVITNILQPLQSGWSALVKADHYQATSTTQASTFPYASTTALSVSTLSSGNCVQAGTGGLLTTVSSPCGSGSGTVTQINTSAPLQGGPITTTGTLSITQSGRSTNGYLSSTDFTTFDNKISSTSLSVTTIGTSGAATYTPATGVFNIPQYQAAGTYVTSVTGTWPIVSSGGTTPAISYAGFGTTTNSGLPVDQFLYTNHSGVVITAASSSLSLPNAALQHSSIVVNGTTFNLGDSKTITAASSTLLSDINTFAANTLFSSNVGIGTVSPSQALSVVGTVAASVSVTTNSVTLARLANIYSSTAATANLSLVFTGARDSAPSFSGTTLTLPSNTQAILVEIWGAGGGGAASNGSTDAGGGGGGAGYAKKLITSPSGTYYYTVGAGGAAQVNEASAGAGTGGATCFGTNATACTTPIMTANGGVGGTQGNFGASGGGGGLSSGGDINIMGGSGEGGQFGTGIDNPEGTGGMGGGGGGGGGTFASSYIGGVFGGGGGGAYAGNLIGGAGGNGGFEVTVYTY